MKAKTLESVRLLEKKTRSVLTHLRKITSATVSKSEIIEEAVEVATFWVEEVRSPVEHRFNLPKDIVEKYSDLFKQLHKISRPKTKKMRYESCLKSILKGYKDDIELPILQSSKIIESDAVLESLVANVKENEISDYLAEAINCAKHGYNKAAIVLGWCATIDSIQQKILRLGFDKFNSASLKLKAAGGRFKRYNKEFKITSMNDLQEVSDGDMIWMLEGLDLLDANQADRLRTCFQYRNNSAHPGHAPIGKLHMHTFFSDVINLVLSNPTFTDGGSERGPS